MEYNWDLDKIRSLKRETQALLKNTEGLTKDDKNTIKQIIQSYEKIENNFICKKNFSRFIENNKFIDHDKFIPKNTYYNYLSIPKEIRHDILKAILCFRNLDNIYDDNILNKINLSDHELVLLAHDFARWLPTKDKKYEELFLKYTNPDNHLLRFTKDTGDHLGSTYYFYYPSYTPYIAVTRDNTIEDLISLNHEISHSIFFENDTYLNDNHNHFYLKELEGHFFEFLSLMFLKDKIDSEEFLKLSYNRFNTQYRNFIDFYITGYAINLFKKKKDISIINFNKKLLKEELPFYIDETSLIDSLNYNPKDDTKYLFSYLVCLDLENIYEFDPEYSFYLFEGIRNNKHDDIYTNLREHGITFMDDGYQSLQKTIKKINNL